MLWFLFFTIISNKHESWSLFYYHDGNFTSQSFTYNSPAVQVTKTTESGKGRSFGKYEHCADILDSVGG